MLYVIGYFHPLIVHLVKVNFANILNVLTSEHANVFAFFRLFGSFAKHFHETKQTSILNKQEDKYD